MKDVVADLSPLQKENLVKAAQDILKNEYALKNNSNYAAAVLTTKGNIYPGISTFSETYTLTLHGEQVAISHAATHGEDEIIAIAVASNEKKGKGKFTNPCHMCKQVLYEVSHRNNADILIILSNNQGETKEVKLSEMISFAWPEK